MNGNWWLNFQKSAIGDAPTIRYQRVSLMFSKLFRLVLSDYDCQS